MAPTATSRRRSQARQSRQEIRARIVAAATELVRHRAYAELSVDELMREAGIGRTIFYRHFDDLPDLLMRASREAIDELLEAQERLGQVRPDQDPEAVRKALQPAVDVYMRHGPLLRGVAEAATDHEQIAAGYAAMHQRFDELVEQTLRAVSDLSVTPLANVAQTARALNLMNESYLLDVFGRTPRVSRQTAVQTLTEIWEAVIRR
ncbi:MAG TPA: TetR/AcrR family transcriptional regulator [Thermoleophilaceae bacterium]|nr:TetR/AcrR family transcriptional regulator [Thermoleophilaceae bacterium]